ncbi:Decarboxylase NovR [compost metagenome]
MVALYGWDDLIFTHITAKVPGTHHFLINPYGLMFEEVTASSLVKIDINGNKVMESAGEINPAGFLIHSCIHAARDNAMCIMHTHSLNGVAVSTQKDGLLPISQFAYAILPKLAYHDFEGFALNTEEQPRLVRDLGNKDFMILRNHGLLTTGANIALAFMEMHRMEAACMVQVRAQGAELIHIPHEIMDTFKAETPAIRVEKADITWKALLRRLDRVNPGYNS